MVEKEKFGDLSLSEELKENIDSVLKKLFKNELVSMNNQNTEIESKAINICKSLNLIRFKANSIFELDEKGVFAIEDGGIEKYLENIRLYKDLEKTIKDLTSKRLKNEVKYNLMYVSLGGVIGIVTSILTVVLTLWVIPDKTEQQIEQLNKSTFDMSVEQSHFQTDLQQMRSEIVSLKTEINSLKKP
jgi:hypothetical protein